MNTWKVIAIVAIILLLGFGGFFSYQVIKTYHFNRGYDTGVGEIILKINQDKAIPVLQYENNETFVVWVVLEEGE